MTGSAIPVRGSIRLFLASSATRHAIICSAGYGASTSAGSAPGSIHCRPRVRCQDHRHAVVHAHGCVCAGDDQRVRVHNLAHRRLGPWPRHEERPPVHCVVVYHGGLREGGVGQVLTGAGSAHAGLHISGEAPCRMRPRRRTWRWAPTSCATLGHPATTDWRARGSSSSTRRDRSPRRPPCTPRSRS